MTLRQAAKQALDVLEASKTPAARAAAKALSEALSRPTVDPIAWHHPMSGRVRWDNTRLPPSWLPLYPEPPEPPAPTIDHDPGTTDLALTTQDKVAKYLREHRRPVSSKTLSNHYLISISAVQRTLKTLSDKGLVAKQRIGSRHTVWSWNHDHPAPTTVSKQDIPNPQPRPTDKNTESTALLDSVRSRPIQNSYPQVRGYDD